MGEFGWPPGCTDWFITFTQLGRGNTARTIAVTPLNLLLQLLLLPVYLWLMLPAADFSAALNTELKKCCPLHWC